MLENKELKNEFVRLLNEGDYFKVKEAMYHWVQGNKITIEEFSDLLLAYQVLSTIGPSSDEKDSDYQIVETRWIPDGG